MKNSEYTWESFLNSIIYTAICLPLKESMILENLDGKFEFLFLIRVSTCFHLLKVSVALIPVSAC